MLFSTRAEYGVRLMVELGRQDGGAPVALSAVADSERLPLEPALSELVRDRCCHRVRHARLAGHGAAHARHARTPARFGEPGRVEAVVPGSRSEVPQHWIAVTWE